MLFQDEIIKNLSQGQLTLQPRMGFSDLGKMRKGLMAVANCRAKTVGTITVDSYTRQSDYESIANSLRQGKELNGYPLVNIGAQKTAQMLKTLPKNFPVQLRHGTPLPKKLLKVMLEAGILSTEGGPLSYCFPYGRIELNRCIEAWKDSVGYLVEHSAGMAHIETFAGCMMGQLCSPDLLIACAILEAIFFKQCGLRSVSLSYAQGTHLSQDVAGLAALHSLAGQYLNDMDWHSVLYTYMGIFPETREGSKALLTDSMYLAQNAGCGRLIVKTYAEAFEIPTIETNIEALNTVCDLPVSIDQASVDEHYDILYQNAKNIVEAVLSLDVDIAKALLRAVQKGLIDIPFCLHPDNAGQTTCYIDEKGALAWLSTGNIPLKLKKPSKGIHLTSQKFLSMLYHVRNKFDTLGLQKIA